MPRQFHKGQLAAAERFLCQKNREFIRELLFAGSREIPKGAAVSAVSGATIAFAQNGTGELIGA